MMINYYIDRIVGVVFFLAVITMLGLYFFPDATLNTVGLTVAGIKPVLGLLDALFKILIEIITAVLSVFTN